jgi:hypothetical protein
MSLLGKPARVWRQIIEQYETVLKAKAAKMRDDKKRESLLALDEW